MGRALYHHFYSIGNRAASTPLEGLEEAIVARRDGGCVWVACVDPERAELERIAEEFAIHPLSVADCFDEEQIPKVDVFPEYAAILFNDIVPVAPERAETVAEGERSRSVLSVSISEINLFFGKDYIVSVFREATASRVSPESIVEGVIRSRLRGVHGPTKILHVILDRVIDDSFAAIDGLGDAIEALEDECLAPGGTLDPARAHSVRQSLSAMRKSLFHERELLARIARRDSGIVPDENAIFFSGLADRVAKFLAAVETDRDSATNLTQLSLAISGDRMAREASRTNRSMTRLTFITTIFMPLTLIAGIGGMSEWTMMTGQDRWKVSYAILVGAMALFGLVNFLVLRRLNRKG